MVIDPIEYAGLQQDGLVPRDVVIRVAGEVRGYTLDESERLCDEIFEMQPVASTHVIALSRHGVSYPMLDRVFHLLMVIYASFKEAGVGLSAINEEMVEKAWDNNMAMGSFFDSETSETERQRLISLGITSYPEPYLLAHLIEYLRVAMLNDGPTDEAELVIGATKSLLDCFVRASRREEW